MDIIVRINKGHLCPQIIIDLNRLEGLSNVEPLSDGRIRIGCMVRIAQLLKNVKIKKHYRALFDGLHIIGSVQIRNRATIAVNICNASPAADTVPPLMVLGATVNIRGLRGTRRVAIAEFFKGRARRCWKRTNSSRVSSARPGGKVQVGLHAAGKTKRCRLRDRGCRCGAG